MLQKHPEAPPVAYDVIVVLGAAVWPGGQPSPALQRRILHAVDLLAAGLCRVSPGHWRGREISAR